MNHGLFKLIFNRRSGLLTPTWEGASACGKASSTARACVLTLTLLFFAQPVLANPSGAAVINGNVSFATNGNTLEITNSPNSIINWQSFSINKDEITRFIQQNGASAVLNRVVGQDPSKILGSLQSNGRVFIINPNGIVFGQGATIDVAGLVASTLKMSDSDFLSGKYNFTDGNGAGAIKNEGAITTATGGQVYLIAPDIENSGIITSPKGEIVLAAGHSVSLVDPKNPQIVVSLTAPVTQAVNVGQLISEGGSIGIYAGLVIQGGTINANSASVDERGRIYLRGTKSTTLTAESVTNASNSAVGGGEGNGAGGGEINISSTETITIAAGASIEANAGQNGNGGLVTVLSDGHTQFDGKISAQGGAQFGDGGFVETSGQTISIGDTARVTTLAVDGSNGTWQIDSNDFTIAALDGAISGATLSANLANGNVSILNSNGANSEGSGDVNVNDGVSWNANKLTLTAARNININAVMSASGTSSLTLNTATANSQNAAASGAVVLGAAVSGGTVRVEFSPDGGFRGRVDFDRAGTGFLSINGNDYTVINSLGQENSGTGTDLQGINGNLSGFYALGANINASATMDFDGGFAPIGFGGEASFFGKFDGLGHIIADLNINRPESSNVGLFSSTSGAEIRNVGLQNANVTGQSNVGVLVGVMNSGSVNSSYVTGVVSGASTVGGLIGRNGGLIDASHASSKVMSSEVGASNIGGLVGRNNFAGNINNSYATGAVTAGSNASNIGGLVGRIDSPDGGGNISNSYATGDVSAESGSFNLGGFAGQNAGDISDSYAAGAVSVVGRGIEISGFVGRNFGTISRSNATGAVSSGMNSVNVSGFVGLNDGVIDSSFATGAVSSEDRSTNTSGFVGGNRGAIRNSFASGVVTGGSSTGVIGGLVGFNSLGDIRDSYFTGSVRTGSSVALVGGLVGLNEGNGEGGSIFNSYSTGNVSTLGNASRVGGLVGENRGGFIANSYATGAVSAGDGAFDVGAFVGRNVSGNFNEGSIDSSYATGAVSGGMGAYNLGGFAGFNDNGAYGGSISNSFATGSVTGGMIADNGAYGGSISNSFATGSVAGVVIAGALGGFVGNNTGTIGTSYSIGYVAAGAESDNPGGFGGLNTGTISNSYWNTETSGQTGSAGGAGLTTAQMLQSSSFVGFDFARTWAQAEGSSFPYQRVLFPNGIQVFSGVVGNYTLGAQRVERLSNGVSFGQNSIGVNGLYYTFSNPNQAINAGQQYQVNLVNGMQRGTYYGDAMALNTFLDFNVGDLLNNSNTPLSFANQTIALNVLNNGTINLNGGTIFTSLFTNNGAVNAISGTTEFRGGGAFNDVTEINSGATVNFVSGIYTINGEVNNSGVVNLSRDIGGEGTINNFGIITANGVDRTDTFSPILNNFGTLNVVGSDSYTLELFGVTNTGTINVADTNTLRLFSGLTNEGVLTGKGTIDVGEGTLINRGTIRPGASPGTLTIVGNLDLTPTSVLDIELASTAPGLFDVLNVSGNVNLAGILNVLQFGNYTASNGDIFGFFNAGLLNGTFSTVTSPATFRSALGYGSNGITLTTFPFVPMPPAPPIDPSLLTTLDFSKLPNTGSGSGSPAGNFNALLEFAPSALIGSGINAEFYLGEPLSGEKRDARLLCN